MTTNTPTIITIKLLAATAPNVKDVQALLAPIGTTLQYEAVNLVFDGNGLVPAPVAGVTPTPAPVETKTKRGGIKPEKQREVARKVQASQAAKRAKEKQSNSGEAAEGKLIEFAPGRAPDRIWKLIRQGPALTSTQIREKLELDSNIVNTTIYRLKAAGMIRPMSYNAPNGDTLYTSTEWDQKPTNTNNTNTNADEVTDGE